MILVVLAFTESGYPHFVKFYEKMTDARRLFVRERLIARVRQRREYGIAGDTFDCAELLGEGSFGVYRQVGSLTVLFGADGTEWPEDVLDKLDDFISELRSRFGESDRQVEEALETRFVAVSHLLDNLKDDAGLETDPDEADGHCLADFHGGVAQQASNAKSFLSGLNKFAK